MSDAPARSSYRHGDLRQALIDAALDMARQGGPDAVVLREATRRAGVSPNAAYRHFADRQDLLEAVSAAAQGLAADAMEEALEAVPGTGDPIVDARLRVGAVGRGYLAFARHEPGLFRTALSCTAGLTAVAATAPPAPELMTRPETPEDRRSASDPSPRPL